MIYSSNLKHIEPLQWAWFSPLTSTDWITCTIFAVPISKIDMESVRLGQPVASAYPFKVSLGSALHNYLWQWGGPWWTAQHGNCLWKNWGQTPLNHGISQPNRPWDWCGNWQETPPICYNAEIPWDSMVKPSDSPIFYGENTGKSHGFLLISQGFSFG
jgi:hypothetical protein